jgi:hypothetical protein
MTLTEVIERSKGHFLTVRFVKKDGTIRQMHCRLGVTKHSKGGESTLDPDKFFTVWDLHSKGYRAINKATVLSVTLKQVSWIVPIADTSEPLAGYVNQD